MAAVFGRYGYRCITALLNEAAWSLGTGYLLWIWRREGPKTAEKQEPDRVSVTQRRLLRSVASHPHRVGSHDFVHYPTYDGRALRLPSLIDEYNYRSVRVACHLKGQPSSGTFCDALLLQDVWHTAVRIRGLRDDLEAATAQAGTGGCQDILISNPAAPGRTATTKVSTASSGNERPDGEILYSLNETHIIIER